MAHSKQARKRIRQSEKNRIANKSKMSRMKTAVKGLLAVAQISNGSIANVNGMRRGHLDAALAQSDVVYWSYHGMAVFGGQPRQDDLRAIAHLYPESLHLVARAGSVTGRRYCCGAYQLAKPS